MRKKQSKRTAEQRPFGALAQVDAASVIAYLSATQGYISQETRCFDFINSASNHCACYRKQYIFIIIDSCVQIAAILSLSQPLFSLGHANKWHPIFGCHLTFFFLYLYWYPKKFFGHRWHFERCGVGETVLVLCSCFVHLIWTGFLNVKQILYK